MSELEVPKELREHPQAMRLVLWETLLAFPSEFGSERVVNVGRNQYIFGFVGVVLYGELRCYLDAYDPYVGQSLLAGTLAEFCEVFWPELLALLPSGINKLTID